MTQDNVLYTVENVPYGGSASYVGAEPTKLGVDNPDDYKFTGWSPLPEKIQGETYCFALFRYKAYLFGKLADPEKEEVDQGYGTVDEPNWDAINSHWTQISNDVNAYKNNEITEDTFKSKYPIGGRMPIPVTLDNTESVIDIEIIEYNHDNLADNSGQAMLTFFCQSLPDIYRRMGADNVGGWQDSEMREFVNGELFNSLPVELQSAIKPVIKISDGGESSKTLVYTEDKCWLASYAEVGFISIREVLEGQGEVYESTFSSDKKTRVKYLSDGHTAYGWWLRSSSYSLSGSSTLFCRVQSSGILYSDIETGNWPVVFGFCI